MTAFIESVIGGDKVLIPASSIAYIEEIKDKNCTNVHILGWQRNDALAVEESYSSFVGKLSSVLPCSKVLTNSDKS